MELSVWGVFVASAAAVVLAGVRLSRDGDAIAEHTGLGRAWVGAILLAGATSLPELTTNVYAVRQGSWNLAAGDLFGSNMANMLILALADLSVRGAGVLPRVAFSQVLVGIVAVVLMSLAAIGVLVRDDASVLGLGWAGLAIGAAYLAGARLLHVSRSLAEASHADGGHHAGAAPTGSLRGALVGFLVAGVVIFVAAGYLAGSAAQIAEQLGVSSGFVGLAMLAIVTSLPEAVVSIASLRTGAHDLAVGNLLGSNCFNMAIFVVLDVVDGPGSLFARIDLTMLVAAVFAMLLTTLALLEIASRTKRGGWPIPPIPGLMVLAYVVGLYLTYQVGH